MIAVGIIVLVASIVALVRSIITVVSDKEEFFAWITSFVGTALLAVFGFTVFTGVLELSEKAIYLIVVGLVFTLVEIMLKSPGVLVPIVTSLVGVWASVIQTSLPIIIYILFSVAIVLSFLFSIIDLKRDDYLLNGTWIALIPGGIAFASVISALFIIVYDKNWENQFMGIAFVVTAIAGFILLIADYIDIKDFRDSKHTTLSLVGGMISLAIILVAGIVCIKGDIHFTAMDIILMVVGQLFTIGFLIFVTPLYFMTMPLFIVGFLDGLYKLDYFDFAIIPVALIGAGLILTIFFGFKDKRLIPFDGHSLIYTPVQVIPAALVCAGLSFYLLKIVNKIPLFAGIFSLVMIFAAGLLFTLLGIKNFRKATFDEYSLVNSFWIGIPVLMVAWALIIGTGLFGSAANVSRFAIAGASILSAAIVPFTFFCLYQPTVGEKYELYKTAYFTKYGESVRNYYSLHLKTKSFVCLGLVLATVTAIALGVYFVVSSYVEIPILAIIVVCSIIGLIFICWLAYVIVLKVKDRNKEKFWDTLTLDQKADYKIRVFNAKNEYLNDERAEIIKLSDLEINKLEYALSGACGGNYNSPEAMLTAFNKEFLEEKNDDKDEDFINSLFIGLKNFITAGGSDVKKAAEKFERMNTIKDAFRVKTLLFEKKAEKAKKLYYNAVDKGNLVISRIHEVTDLLDSVKLKEAIADYSETNVVEQSQNDEFQTQVLEEQIKNITDFQNEFNIDVTSKVLANADNINNSNDDLEILVNAGEMVYQLGSAWFKNKEMNLKKLEEYESNIKQSISQLYHLEKQIVELDNFAKRGLEQSEIIYKNTMAYATLFNSLYNFLYPENDNEKSLEARTARKGKGESYFTLEEQQKFLLELKPGLQFFKRALFAEF